MTEVGTGVLKRPTQTCSARLPTTALIRLVRMRFAQTTRADGCRCPAASAGRPGRSRSPCRKKREMNTSRPTNSPTTNRRGPSPPGPSGRCPATRRGASGSTGCRAAPWSAPSGRRGSSPTRRRGRDPPCASCWRTWACWAYSSLLQLTVVGMGRGGARTRGVSIMVMALSWFEPFEQSVEIHARLGVGIDCDAG